MTDMGQDGGAQRLRHRIDHAGTTAFTFRAPQILWTPDLAQSGEVVLEHQLGRIPQGLWLVSQEFSLRWSVPSEQRAKWTDQLIYFRVEEYHPYWAGTGVFQISDVTESVTLDRPRDADAEMIVTSCFDHQVMTDHPPLKVYAFTTTGENTTGIDFRFANEMASGAVIPFNFDVLTQLAPGDRFEWQVY